MKFKDGVSADGASAIVIPSGFMMMVAGNKCTLLRWSLVADEADKSRARVAIKNMIESFPELRGEQTGWVQFAEHLGVRT